jgi:hypothetical protein
VTSAAADPPRLASPVVGRSAVADAARLPDLVHHLASVQASGCVTVSHADWEGQLFLEGGRIMGASLVTRGDAAVVEALASALPDACFTFTPGPPTASPGSLSQPVAPTRGGRRGWLVHAEAGRRVLTVLLTLFVLAGLLALRPNSNATPNPSADAAAPPAALDASGPVSAADASVLLDERFGDQAHNWPSDPQGTAWLADGAYHLASRRPGRFVALGAPLPDVLGDVIVSATFHRANDAVSGGYGVILRDQGSGRRDGTSQAGWYYLLAVNEKREVGIWRRENDRWKDLLPWRGNDAVHPGTQPNDLTVFARGDQLTFVVNGHKVASQADQTQSAGHVGVFVGGDTNEVILDRFTVRLP